ncbi:hypothetical protein, partial [Thiolapillus sp.]|uniref:hypothetical protein n=1 Tax=Thiolapillus sp. TaxID=2017437 RepID=UPI0025DA7924
ALNLHRDTDEKDLSEDRGGDRKWRFHIGKRERGREEKRKNGELSNRSLKTEGRQTVENLKRNLLKERGEESKRTRAEI